MERYIIRVRTDLRPPDYLLNIDPQYFTIEDETFWPLDWRDRKFYSLNESQDLAFKAAMTQEFAIIQGPPGTGKTFLGLKIAKTLIENRSVWFRNSPILIICFTNHALDQFLEGLLDTTHDIVRVGSQSKHKKLEPFNIKNKRALYSDQAVSQKRREVRSVLTELKTIDENLKIIEQGQTIMQFDIFDDVVPQYADSRIAYYNNREIFSWLFNGIDRRRMRPREIMVSTNICPFFKHIFCFFLMTIDQNCFVTILKLKIW